MAARRMMHRASVVREEVDLTAIRPTVNVTTVYAALPCLLIPVSGRALRDEDRAVGNEVYKLLHLEGQLAVNDKVTVATATAPPSERRCSVARQRTAWYSIKLK